MDANQPKHYGIWVYDDSPMHSDGYATTLCPGARHLSRADMVQKPDQVTCRRCGELLDVIGLRTIHPSERARRNDLR